MRQQEFFESDRGEQSTAAASRFAWKPLAEHMRPENIADFVGQEHILSPGKPLYLAINNQQIHSMILWGPPGSGKTTLARMMARGYDFIALSAVMSGVREIRQAIRQAQQNLTNNQQTILFIDEVHRFNKSQQDAFLPYIEDGTIIFIGATTENPSFELNNALLSRTRVYLLKTLSQKHLLILIEKCLQYYRQRHDITLEMAASLQQQIAMAAQGDARRLYGLLELIMGQALITDEQGKVQIDQQLFTQIIATGQTGGGLYDKGGDIFYDQISAFHKSIRGSSPDGALYWMSRMLLAGCDPLYIARRLLAIASEDIGNADPRAMTIALNAWEAYHRLGAAEGHRAIAQAAVYCAMAAKSNAVYTAFKAAMKLAKETKDAEVPLHLRNAPTDLMQSLGYGKEYRYSHDEEHAFSAGQTYFPDALGEQQLYHPVERGLEIKIAEKLRQLRHANLESSAKAVEK